MQNLAGEKQMTSDTKKQSSPKPIRVLDEQDQVWSSIKELTVGMTPEERSLALRQFVESLPEAQS
jgi:hypothetical protein